MASTPSSPLIKNVTLAPAIVPNDGEHAVTLSCTVFSPLDDTGIRTVSFDARGTAIGHVGLLEPMDGCTIARSGEGDYHVTIPIPATMDTGVCRFIVEATDSRGVRGSRSVWLEVTFARGAATTPPGDPSLLDHLATLAHTTVVPASHLELLPTGEAALARRLELVRRATRHILLQSYTLVGKGMLEELRQALVDKAREGVEVVVVLNGDTQIATGLSSTIELRLEEVRLELLGKLEELAEATDSALMAKLVESIGGTTSGSLSVIVFMAKRARELEERRTDAPPRHHWWERYRRAIGSTAEGAAPSREDDGDHKLPALPLLDYAIHEKLLVVDGQEAILGGRNLEDKYFTFWEDLDVAVRGPVATAIAAGLRRTIREVGEGAPPNERTATEEHDTPDEVPHDRKAGETEGLRCVFVQSRPWLDELYTLDTLVHAIRQSDERILVTSQFVILRGGILLDALLDACRRGVEVAISTNSMETAKEVLGGLGYALSLETMGVLLEGGVQLFEAEGFGPHSPRQPYVHTKEMIFDDRLVAVGSFNLSIRSSYLESENLLFIDDPSTARARREAFRAHTTHHAVRLDRDSWRARREETAMGSLASRAELLF